MMILPNAAFKSASKKLRFDEDFSDGSTESDTSLDIGTMSGLGTKLLELVMMKKIIRMMIKRTMMMTQ